MSKPLVVKVLVLALGALALVAVLAVDTTIAADASGKDPKLGAKIPRPEYPAYAEVEYERSVIRIPVRRGGDTKAREILELTAFMRLEREAPVRNTIGYRQLEFTIREWELFGYSEVLGGHVSFTASQDVVQPKSLVVALQKNSDYPSLIVYNAIYDIFLDGRKIVSQRPGVAMARGVMEIPPRNVTVAFQKPFMVKTSAVGYEVSQSGASEKDCGPGCTIFDPGTCEDMSTISAEEFNAGLQEARAIREQLATLKPKPRNLAGAGKGSGSR